MFVDPLPIFDHNHHLQTGRRIMSSTPTSLRRLSFRQVYVDVPPSPYFPYENSFSANSTQIYSSHNLKENAPLRLSHASMSQPSTGSTSHKRKLSDLDLSATMAVATTKKTKLAPGAGGKVSHSEAAESVSPEFPNGFVYCHQCSKKRDVAGMQANHSHVLRLIVGAVSQTLSIAP